MLEGCWRGVGGVLVSPRGVLKWFWRVVGKVYEGCRRGVGGCWIGVG